MATNWRYDGVEGRIIADTGPWNSVQVRLTQYYERTMKLY